MQKTFFAFESQLSDLPDAQLVGHLNDFFAMLERSMDHIAATLRDDLQEIRLLVYDLQRLGITVDAYVIPFSCRHYLRRAD